MGRGRIYVVVASLFVTCAVALSLASTAWCAFVKRNVAPTNNDDLSNIEEELRDFLLSSHGVGFWSWRLGDSCFSYRINGQDPSFDTKFNSAKAFAVLAAVLGGLLMFILWFAMCAPLPKLVLPVTAVFLLLNTLFQGLSLLIFRSSICKPGFYSYAGNFPQDATLPAVNCSLLSGSRCCIAATVLFFCGAVACALAAKDPPEFDDSDIEDGEIIATSVKQHEVPEEPIAEEQPDEEPTSSE